MATITFDGPSKIITIGYDSAITNVEAIEIYSRWKEWVALGNAQFMPAFSDSVGGNPLGGGVGLGQYVFLNNDLGWRITGAAYNYEVRIVGDLYFMVPDGAVFNLVPAKSVIFSVQRSVGSTIVDSGGGGGGTVDADAVAAAVWNRPMADHQANGSFGKRLKELLPLHWGVK
jgi:hypothetical protein